MKTIELTEKEYWRTLRKQKKIKLREIADLLKCSIAFLSMYENDKTLMRPEAINQYKDFIQNK
ncbi:MAG: helix-turn-helix transcriptional regulator [Desulfitobacterium hafniense]|nr:helix-turn-helix transcriptional regulator [Desulfitobacterium hafniense]MEA5023926.1 helix-turn-helix transcriptional regulator [Desulfitobacterium hafniense]